MALDYAYLRGLAPLVKAHAWTERDTILYALGVGADELPFVYEAGLTALPTMCCVLGYPGFFWTDPSYGVDWRKMLHVDPALAAAAGFERPILHGMCTYGVVGRALVKALCGGDPTRISMIGARFTAPVFPGETIRAEIWMAGTGKARFRARVAERDLIVLDGGSVAFQ